MTERETEHLFSLADSLGVTLRTDGCPHGSWGSFDRETRTAYVAGGHRRAYVTALHELGHAATGTDERQAWVWARNYSARPWTADEHDFARKCLQSYGI